MLSFLAMYQGEKCKGYTIEFDFLLCVQNEPTKGVFLFLIFIVSSSSTLRHVLVPIIVGSLLSTTVKNGCQRLNSIFLTIQRN